MKQIETDGAVLRYWDFAVQVKNDKGEVLATGDWVRKATKVQYDAAENVAEVVESLSTDETKALEVWNAGLAAIAAAKSGTVPAGCFPKSWVKSVVASLKGSPKFKALGSADRNIAVMRYLGEKPAVKAGFEAALTENPPEAADEEE